MTWDDHIRKQLAQRESEGLLRTLPNTEDNRPDFVSNDYLGLARYSLASAGKHGSTGSRLLAGNSKQTEELEQELATYHSAEAGLLFNSGFQANVGLFQALADRGDTILYDEFAHASMRDGIRLSHANAYGYRHNDLQDLRDKLSRATGKVLIAVEALYSMDGDFAPLEELAAICKETGARLYVDEAHSNGLYGAGLAAPYAQYCLVRLYTFGKAVGCHGAVAVGSEALKQYLINFARSFIYTTALPPSTLSAIQQAYKLLPELNAERKRLSKLVDRFRNFLEQHKLPYTGGHSPIFGILGKANLNKVHALAVRYPTVPRGKERTRICLHSFNTEEEMELLEKELIG